jgi:hypothetical protein
VRRWHKCEVPAGTEIVCLSGDSVAKVPKCLAPNFSQKDETSDNRRSMCPEVRHRSRP